MRRWTSLLALLLLLTACGDDDGPAGTPAPAGISFDFTEDLEGWEVATSSVDWGKAQWLDRGRGLIHLDGVGDDDPGPNAWAWKVVELPAGARQLRFTSSAHDRGDGTGWLRVRLVDAGGISHNLVPLHVLQTGEEGFDFQERTADLSAFAGTSVTLYFELEDADGGGNNQRYIDVVEILD
jgi:hypothetical protein